MVERARRVVVFTGAGVSTECGIPDFRSPGGLWTRFKPIPFQEFRASAQMRLEAWRRYFVIYESVREALPGRGHHAIAALHERGKVSHVITQNIDGLHRAAGMPEESVIELHGNGTYAACLDCGLRHELEEVRGMIADSGEAPQCRSCGGPVKTATVSFGQAMPEQAMADARAATLDADLFLAVGSSLQVFPAAGFPILAKNNGAALIIINNEPTPLDVMADLIIAADAGGTLERITQGDSQPQGVRG
ncbi:NAD-dependent protein deacetylase [soil metagenome]